MREQDWATGSWFEGFQDHRVSVINANRHFAGMVGFVRLARDAGDVEAERLGRALLAKAAILRVSIAKYPRYLYEWNLVSLPAEPDWQIRYTADQWSGQLFNYHWTDAYDDPRQPVVLDQFEVSLRDHSGFREWVQTTSAHLVAFRDMTPELGRLLGDFAWADTQVYVDKVEALVPHWYGAFGEGILGGEHNLSHPVDSFQVFMAKSLIEGTTGQELADYVDIPWLSRGDLFYLHKLAEAIKVYRGVVWDDSVSLSGVPQNEAVGLTWRTHSELPPNISWRIDYQGPEGDEPSPITDILSSTRSYRLTGLVNHTWYSFTVSAVSGDSSLLTSNPLRLWPAQFLLYGPLILKAQ
jgi:hypothetical protein